MRMLVWTITAWLLASRGAIAADTSPAVGLRVNTPDRYALAGARIIVSPGQVIENGTVLIRDGKIDKVVSGDGVPAGIRRIDLSGKTIYPGFIDSYSELNDAPEAPGPGYWNGQVTPQRSVATAFQPEAEIAKALRSQGFTARLVAPRVGVIKGQSALVLTSDGSAAESVLRDTVALHIRLTVPFGGSRGYPNSPMGAVALARQAMYDAQWYEQAAAAVRADASLPRPDANLALATLTDYLDGSRLVLADAPNELFALRADRFAREFSLRLALIGSGNEYRQLDAIRDTRRTVVVPVDFPKPPEVASPARALDVSLEELMHWRLAPENPGRLVDAGVPIAFTTDGLKDRGQFLARLREAVERGLSPEAALRALTTTPAELFGVEGLMGAVEAGKLANLVVADGDLFDKKSKVVATWVHGEQYEMKPEPIVDFRGKWSIKSKTPLGPTRQWMLAVSGEPDKPRATIELEAKETAAKETSPDRAEERESAEPNDESKGEAESGSETKEESAETSDEAKASESDKLTSVAVKPFKVSGFQMSGALDGKQFDEPGKMIFSATLSVDGEDELLMGEFHLPDGSRIPFTAQRLKEEAEKPDKNHDDETSEGQEHDEDEELEQEDRSKNDAENAEAEEKKGIDEPLVVEVNYPLGEFGRTSPPEQEAVAFTNATVWTCGPEGILEGATVLIRDGLIVAVGKEVDVPEGVRTIDCEGRHLTPGIIDCHSHIATDGGINETGQAVTAEVRISDLIDPDDITIYRQLAGGVTAANILHGSANPIGGQNQVIKFRWGASAEAMKFAEAPPGIKFALGENVKQSNWERANGRYPQTRMGVDELMIDEFQAALAYRDQWQRWRRDATGLPPRRDLELEAILEILEAERWIHCHSYRQTEILALLRTLERFNVKIGTLQHILEGYKIAPEMAAHGAMGSSFSDWWAYKFEVYDAIPYNGALMHRAGIVVSFNSDDHEMGRRLNQEAAKAIKYGDVPPEEALKFVTLNPAKQLRIEQHVGSIESGKHADLALWSGPPLSTYSCCEQTWVDGRRYFDIDEDQKTRERDETLRARLVQAVLSSGEDSAKPGENRADPSSFWPRYDEFCSGHLHDHEEHEPPH